MRIGFLGLGKMGKRIVAKLLEDGHEVVVWNRSYETSVEFEKEQKNNVILASKARPGSDSEQARMTIVKEIKDFAQLLAGQKIFWVMLPAGEATESALGQLDSLVVEGDTIIDGGNSFYKDTQKWYKHFEKMHVGFLGIGVSGGILAAENGFPLMVGGDRKSFEKIRPLLETLSHPRGGYDYFGSGGAGHFVKMVHNGVEYGMMQSIGEGFGVLEKSQYGLDLEKVANIWTKNTIVAGFLMDRAKDALQKDPKLEKIIGEIDATGEALWTIGAAKEEQVPVGVIEQSLAFRKKSKTDKKIAHSTAAKMVAALRHEFGGHKVNYVHDNLIRTSKMKQKEE